MSNSEIPVKLGNLKIVRVHRETWQNENMTLELVDLEDLGEKALEDFSQSVKQSPGGSPQPLEDAIKTLVAKVEFTYALAAKLAHREQTLEGTAAIWTKMVTICDQVAAHAQRLEAPQSGGAPSFDRILDLRNAAERRRELHS
jgi:hypothetical protein